MQEQDGKIRLECPECRAAMKGPEELLDRLIECPRCKASVSLRRPVEEKAAPPPDAADAPETTPAVAGTEKKQRCAACKELIPLFLKLCPFCGKEPYEKRINAKRWTGVLAGVGCLVLIVLVCAMMAFVLPRADRNRPKTPPAYMQFFDPDIGYHPGMVEKAKGQSQYPESFEHISTKIGEIGGGYLHVWMKYRIKDEDGVTGTHEIMNQIDKKDGTIIS